MITTTPNSLSYETEKHTNYCLSSHFYPFF
jgi:hypothetical protein